MEAPGCRHRPHRDVSPATTSAAGHLLAGLAHVSPAPALLFPSATHPPAPWPLRVEPPSLRNRGGQLGLSPTAPRPSPTPHM